METTVGKYSFNPVLSRRVAARETRKKTPPANTITRDLFLTIGAGFVLAVIVTTALFMIVAYAWL